MYNDGTISQIVSTSQFEKKNCLVASQAMFCDWVSAETPMNEKTEIIKNMQFSDLPLKKVLEREVRWQFVTYKLPWRRKCLIQKTTFYKHELLNES